MDTIGRSQLWSFFDAKDTARTATNTEIRRGPGHRITSFLDLATKVAELQFRNREHVLFFRGQNKDYRNRNDNSSLKPALLRSMEGVEENPNPTRLTRLFEKLKDAEKQLIRLYTS